MPGVLSFILPTQALHLKHLWDCSMNCSILSRRLLLFYLLEQSDFYCQFIAGVSYRKGLNLERQSTSKESMTLAAVDEEAVVNSVSLLSDRPR